MGVLQVLVIESPYGTFGNLGKMRFIIPILMYEFQNKRTQL